MRRPPVSLVIAASLLLAALQPDRAAASPPVGGSRPETAIFAGGCFWSMESQFEGLPGVTAVVSGYIGGRNAHPTYENAHTNGHLEAIRVTFDPAVTTYNTLLDRYWHGIDPTQDDGQFCDRGATYRTAIFVQGDGQRREAEASRAALERSHVLRQPIRTRILPAPAFWPAEAYHQDFWRKNPERYFSYREGCGRDQRLTQLWGAAAVTVSRH